MKVEDIQLRSALALGSGTADRNGAVLDMQNKEWAIAVATFTSVSASAVTSIKLQQGSQSDMSDAADLAGTALSVADDDDGQIFAIAITKPRERYIRVVVDKDGSNSTTELVHYIEGGHRTLESLSSITDELTVEIHHSPAEGTA